MRRKKIFRRKKKASRKPQLLKKSAIVYGEMIKDKGEDFYMLSEYNNYGIIGVFDGCGGSGSQIYSEYENHTGAYISSRSTAAAVLRWFDKFCTDNRLFSKNTIEDICIDIENQIFSALKKKKKGTAGHLLKGSMLKDFPTTASIILYRQSNGSLYSAFMWCGDSRGYVLQKKGLVQVTVDDIYEDLDAFSNLRSDGQLTNVISADGDFILHSKVISCNEPTILITATDGCFGYFPSPMAFEYMLVETLMDADCIDDWKNKIDCCLRQIAGDDYTIGIYIYGFDGSFNTVKDYFYDRKQCVYHYFLSKWDEADQTEKQNLWEEYKSVYYGEVR